MLIILLCKIGPASAMKRSTDANYQVSSLLSYHVTQSLNRKNTESHHTTSFELARKESDVKSNASSFFTIAMHLRSAWLSELKNTCRSKLP